MAEKVSVRYFLPETVVKLSGTVTTRENVETGSRERVSSASTVELLTRADATDPRDVELETAWLKDHKLTVALAEDGRLLSTDSSTSNRAAKIAGSVVSFTTSAVALAVGLGARLGGAAILEADGEGPGGPPPPPPPPPSKAEQEYGAKFPKNVARRQKLSETSDALESKLADLYRDIGGNNDQKDLRRLSFQASELRRAIDDLQTSIAELDAHFATWLTRRQHAETKSYDFRFPVSRLPKVSEPGEMLELPSTLHPHVRAAYDALGAIVVRSDEVEPPDTEDDRVGRENRSVIHFRLPRSVALSHYALGSDQKLHLIQRTHVWVVDDFSARAVLPVTGPNLTAAFWDSGSLKTVSGSTEAKAQAAAEVLGALPENVRTGLEQANKVIDQAQALSLQGAEQRLAELDLKKKQLEAEIAEGDMVTLRTKQSALKQVNADIDLVKARKQLSDLLSPPTPPPQPKEPSSELLQLKIELERGQLERLRLEAELAALRVAINEP